VNVLPHREADTVLCLEAPVIPISDQEDEAPLHIHRGHHQLLEVAVTLVHHEVVVIPQHQKVVEVIIVEAQTLRIDHQQADTVEVHLQEAVAEAEEDAKCQRLIPHNSSTKTPLNTWRRYTYQNTSSLNLDLIKN
jgi:hypothetical protein